MALPPPRRLWQTCTGADCVRSTGSLHHRRRGARSTDAGEADDRSVVPALQPPEQLQLGYVMSRLDSLYSTAAPQGRRILQDTGRRLVKEGGATSDELCGIVTQSAPRDEETLEALRQEQVEALREARTVFCFVVVGAPAPLRDGT